MSAQPMESPVALTTLPSADDGPVADIAGGFDSLLLQQIEDDEELFALEGEAGHAAGALPDEAGTAPLADQPTRAPSRKVKAAGLGGLLGALPAPLLAALDTVTVSEPVLTALGAALTLAGALAAAYIARERTPGA